jgi:hypothetical protein
VFQVKFGHMDAVLTFIKEAAKRMDDSGRETRILTDASGEMFTLVTESKFESIDAHRQRLQESYGNAEASAMMDRLAEHMESGRTEYYNIELEM